MKKTILLLALLSFSAAAQAGSYSDAVISLRMCDFAGNLAVNENQAKVTGKSMSEVIAMLEQNSPGGVVDTNLLRTVQKIYANTYTDDEAHSVGWGACMDSLPN